MVDLRGRHAGTTTEVFAAAARCPPGSTTPRWRSPRSRRSSTGALDDEVVRAGAGGGASCRVASRWWVTSRSWCSTAPTTPTPSRRWRGPWRRTSPSVGSAHRGGRHAGRPGPGRGGRRAVGRLRPDLVMCTSVEGERGVACAGARRVPARRAGLPAEVRRRPAGAVTRALAIAAEEDLVVVCGSFRLWHSPAGPRPTGADRRRPGSPGVERGSVPWRRDPPRPSSCASRTPSSVGSSARSSPASSARACASSRMDLRTPDRALAEAHYDEHARQALLRRAGGLPHPWPGGGHGGGGPRGPDLRHLCAP